MISRVEYFGADWCGPCRTFKPVLIDSISSEKLNMFDVEKNSDLASKRGVRSLPTTILFNETGEEVKRFVGSANKKELQKYLD
jgi:thioredoxin-like negative regulator of GroEL